MSVCVLLAGTPRSGTNAVGRFLHRCGFAAWGESADGWPAAWNHEWAECAALWRIVLWSLMPDHRFPDHFMPRPVPFPAGGVAALAGYLRERDAAASRSPLVVKSNWTPFIVDHVLAAMPGREHVLAVCERDPAASANSLAAVTGVAAETCLAYVSEIGAANETLAADPPPGVKAVVRIPFPGVVDDPRGALAPLVTAAGIRPQDGAYSGFDRSRVRH